MASGIYYENVIMKSHVDLLGGYEGVGWTRNIKNNPTIIDGGGQGNVVKMEYKGEGYATFDGFIVRNGDYGFYRAVLPSVWDLIISNNEFIGAGIRIEILGSVTIKNNIIHDVPGDAMLFRQPNTLSIINNLIYNNDSGCYTFHEVATTKYINNTFVNNGTGIKMQRDKPHIISNNIIIGNDIGIENTVSAEYTITNNNVWNNQTNYLNCTPGTGTISKDAFFSDSESNDYNLTADSPCIDAGTNDAPELPKADLNNNSRIIDGDGDEVAIVDIGAFELQEISPVADITVSSITGLTTNENFAIATFTIVLNVEPVVDVTIDISSSNETDGAIFPEILTFRTLDLLDFVLILGHKLTSNLYQEK